MISMLDSLFSPKSIAIIGASSKPGRQGYAFTMELYHAGYEGKIYPVNPKGGSVEGHTIYKNLDEVGEAVDLALLLVNKERILDAVADCARHGVKTGVIFTAGFAEMGEEGRALQKEMVRCANEHGMRLVGPNCMGIFSASRKVNLTSFPIPAGRIALVSQSGNAAITLWYDAAHYLQTGFSRVICFGNQADICVHEYIDFCANDPESDVIAIYVEGLKLGTGLDFIRSAAAAAQKKPVVIMKGGTTATGQRAAASHTGSLAGSERLYEAAFHKAGIVQVKHFEHLLPVAQALQLCPPMKGRNLAVAGTGGGHMILSSDAADRAGFTLPPFSKECGARIDELFYDFAPKGNPCEQAGTFLTNLDVWGEMTDAILAEPQIDGMFTFGNIGGSHPDLVTNGVNWERAMKNFVAAKDRHQKPVVAYSLSARGREFVSNDIMRQGGIPVFDSIDTAMRCMQALREFQEGKERGAKIPEMPVRQGSAPACFAQAEGRAAHNLTEPEAYGLLKEYHIPMAEYAVAKTAAEAAAAAARLGFPVVMKVISPQIIHKSDFGGVKVGIENEAGAVRGFEEIMKSCLKKQPEAEIHGVLVAKQSAGAEMIAGLIKDRQFGPVLMIGLGGIFVELMKDVAFSVLPATKEEIREKLVSLKGFPLLDGARGRIPCDVDALVDMLYQLSLLAAENPEIKEMDLNPIFVSPDGVAVGDARIILEDQ